MNIYNLSIYNGNVSSFESRPLKLDNIFGYCIQSVFTGSPSGVILLQGSNDSVQIISNPVNWNDIENSSQGVSSAGTITYNVTEAFYNWVRVVYTDSSGGTAVGTCSITGNCKGA